MIGIPVSYNLAFVQTDNIGSMDAEIRVSLKTGHRPTREYMQKIRDVVAHEMPGAVAYFQPADIVSQVINFGVSSPIDVQIEGADFRQSLPLARRLQDAMVRIAGTADVHLTQVLDYPGLSVNIDRQRAAYVGLTERDVASSLLTSLSSSGLLSPSYFLNPANNVNYQVVVKTPLPKVSTVQDLMGTPMTPAGSGAVLAPTDTATPSAETEAPSVVLAGVADIQPTTTPNQISHFTVQRVLDVAANADGRDLGSVVRDIEHAIDGLGKLPAGVHRLEANVTPVMAALEAGKTRLRPVMMTALAMIIGMIPMALGLGEAGEQNAPLGRAVIGGLTMATFITLLLVPAVYASLRTKMPMRHLLDDKFKAEARGEAWMPPATATESGQGGS
jgi:multidrug efflux pump subunit AcrB